MRGVLDVVHTSDRVVAAEQVGRVVARIAVPRRRISRRRLTEGEAGELQEHVFDTDVTAADAIKHATAQTRGLGRNAEVDGARRTVVVELPVALGEGADNAVLGGGTGINRQRHTGTGVEVVEVTVALTEITRVSGLVIDTAVERSVDAQITADLDAGISARDIPESGTIQGADPHVFDRFGLHGRSAACAPPMATRAAAEPRTRLLTIVMLNLQVCPVQRPVQSVIDCPRKNP